MMAHSVPLIGASLANALLHEELVLLRVAELHHRDVVAVELPDGLDNEAGDTHGGKDPEEEVPGNAGECCSLVEQDQSPIPRVFGGAGHPNGLEGEYSIMDAPTFHEAALLFGNCC